MPRIHLLAVLAALLALTGPAPAGGRPAKLPHDLDLLPRDGLGFVSLRVADLWRSEAAALLRDKDGMLGPMVQRLPVLEKLVGIKLAEVERVTLYFPGMSPVVVIRFGPPVDRDRLLKSGLLDFDVPEEKLDGRPYYVRKQSGHALMFPDDRTLVWAAVQVLEDFRKGRKKGEAGPLAPDLEAAASSQVTVAFQLPHDVRVAGPQLLATVPALQSLKVESLTQAVRIRFTADLRADVRARLALTFDDPKAAAAAEEVIRRVTRRAAEALPDFREGLADTVPGMTPDGADWPFTKLMIRGVKYLKVIEDGLKKAEVRRDEKKVEFSLRLAESRGLAEAFFLSQIVIPMLGQQMVVKEMPVNRGHADELLGTDSLDNLRQVASAMLKYHDKHGRLPPSVTRTAGHS
jgi:hypothetical protein